MSDRAVPWKMSMAMLRRPSCPSRLARKLINVAVRLPLLLRSRVLGALVGLPGSTCTLFCGAHGRIKEHAC